MTTAEISQTREGLIRRSKRAARIRKTIDRVAINLLGVIILVFILFPMLWLILTSIKTQADAWAVPVQYWPREPTLAAYQSLWAGHTENRSMALWWMYFLNSALTAGVASILVSIIAVVAGYAFARFSFKLSMFLLLFLLGTHMLPGPSILVSIYLMMGQLGLQDNLLSLIILYTAFGIPFATWLSTGFLRNVPVEIEEAALIDGCSTLQSFVSVVLPLAKVGVVTVLIITFIGAWGEYAFASVLIDTQSKWTATVAMARFVYELTIDFTMIGAAATTLAMPILVMLLLAQRSFVRGLTAGALKEF